MRFLFVLLSACYCVSTAAAELLPSSEAISIIKRISMASRKVSFVGTYLHQHGAELETFRIARVVDSEGEYEKREPLEGVAREIVRSNGIVSCYLPEPPANPAEVKRTALTKLFPSLVNDDSVASLGYFSIGRLANERVAGVDAQVLVLEPKDALRYGRKLWFDPSSGILLKVVSLSRKNEIVEQFAFTELSVGNVERKQVRPRYANRVDIITSDRSHSEYPKPQVDAGWEVRSLPAGYRIVRESKVAVGARLTPVSHMWLSDGWGAVSVFIEPIPKAVPEAQGPVQKSGVSPVGAAKSSTATPHVLINQGTVNVYSRSTQDANVVVMGDVPEAVVTAIGNSIFPKPVLRSGAGQ